MKKESHKKIRKAVVILFWLAVWQAAAVWMNNRILLVGPLQVMDSFMDNIMRPDFLTIVSHSLARIGLGFFTAFFAGVLLGTVSCRFSIMEELLAPVMAALKSIPVASFVVLLLIWFGSGRLSFFISFLIVFPNVYVNTIAGLRSTDVKLLEMARVFGMDSGWKFFYIYRPALMPYLGSCLKISLGMSWKSGVAAEIIGLSESSLGERLYMSKIYLDTAGLFAWTMAIVFISFLFEKTVLWLLRRFAEWRPYPVFGLGEYAHRRVERARTMPLDAFVHKRVSSGVCAGSGMERKDVEDVTEGEAECKSRTENEKGAESGIQMFHIVKSYDGKPVLQDLNLMVEAGGRYLLMAPSGTGKTTLLKILAGLERADRGEIQGMTGRIGMVFQEDRLCEEYDAVCNIMLGMGMAYRKELKKSGMSGSRLKEYVRAQAAEILPEDCLTKQVSNLSGGMRRRVALLRAVLSGADMLIMDEPFTGLDEENRGRCAKYLVKQLHGRTLLVATHREEDVALLQGKQIYF